MEMKFKIFHNGELSGGLAALKEYFPFISADGIELAAVRTDNVIRAEKRKGKITVEYSDLPSFFYTSYLYLRFRCKGSGYYRKVLCPLAQITLPHSSKWVVRSCGRVNIRTVPYMPWRSETSS